MSLRFRLLASIVAVLLAALAIGGVLACRQAQKSVQTEMDAALAGGTMVVRQSVAIHGVAPPLSYIKSLVRSFDGQRHVQVAFLLDGVERGQSRLASYNATVPDWFTALINVPSKTVRIPLSAPLSDSSAATLILRTRPGNEIGEVWNQTRDAVAIMILFCGGTFVLVYVLIGQALRSLSRLEAGFGSISEGNYETAILERGPPEFRALARGFNRMTGRLGAYAKRNTQLQEQLVKLQDEERAWIARDLHDEVGPYLFAIGVDAEAIPILIDARNSRETAKRADAIREAVAHIQKHIRVILRQLRPVEHLDFGLDAAVRDALAFWQRRYPEIRFDLDIRLNGAEIARSVEEVVYRVVRESINNAVRHGQPQCIGVSIICSEPAGITMEIVDDGEGLPVGPLRKGMGLDGMAARIRALNGAFEVVSRAAGPGVRVTAAMPTQAGAMSIQAPAA
jgi:two-component system, NarL family, sensor histidine kinase UhpB